jgi:hypothetical protein
MEKQRVTNLKRWRKWRNRERYNNREKYSDSYMGIIDIDHKIASSQISNHGGRLAYYIMDK